MRVDDLLFQLVSAAKEKKLAKRSIAAMAGLHQNTMLHFGSPEWTPSVATIRRLEAVLLAPDRRDL